MTEQKNIAGVNTVSAADYSCKLNPMMTAREVMHILQISRPTLRRYAQKGILK